MGWTFRFGVVVSLLVGSCVGARAETEPSIVFQVDLPRQLHRWSSVMGTCASFSADGRVLAVHCDGNVKIWSVPEGQEVAELIHDGHPLVSVVFAPRDMSVATLDCCGAVRIWRLSQDEWELAEKIERSDPTCRSECSAGWSLAFSPDGRFLAWHDRYSKKKIHLRVWDLEGRKEAGEIPLHNCVERRGIMHYVGFSADGERLKTIVQKPNASKFVHEVRTWSARTFRSVGKPLRVGLDSRSYRMASQGGQIGGTGLILSADGVMRAHLTPDGEKLELADMTTGKKVLFPRFLAPVPGGRYAPPRLRFSPDRSLLALSTGFMPYILLWEVETGKPYARLTQPAEARAAPAAFSRDGRYLFTYYAVSDRDVGTVWDLGGEGTRVPEPEDDTSRYSRE
jgi:WD40 repeat protein